MQRPVIAIFGRPQGFPDKILIKLDLCPVALKGAGTRPGTCLRSVWRHNQTERDNEPQELEQTEDRSERRKFRAVSEHYTGHTLESGRSCFFFYQDVFRLCVWVFLCRRCFTKQTKLHVLHWSLTQSRFSPASRCCHLPFSLHVCWKWKGLCPVTMATWSLYSTGLQICTVNQSSRSGLRADC